jgi:hypothetical protein
MPRIINSVFLACCLVCLVCVPFLIIGGLVMLGCYAVVSEIADLFLGGKPEAADAREIAQRLCYRNDG